ncbi:MAG: hypothetical protein DRN33_03755 [Thermoplasmata archaeon]|nr:MAG: hypothetical protein DRN33_03755 [Thermoplasmata archaeon]
MSCNKPNWILLKECAEELTKAGKTPFTRKQLIECIHEKYPERGKSSLNPMIQGMTVNRKGGAPGGIGKNVFYSVGRGLFELYDPKKHKPSLGNALTAPAPKLPKKRTEIPTPKTRHDERCPKCKETVKKLLEKIYGKVESNYKFDIGTHPEDFRNTPYYDQLKEVYNALQNHRGFKVFVKAKTLPRCDFFIPNPGFIVEFDESQHFTLPRKIALEHYSKKFEFGFDVKRWASLCERINAKDSDPPYRDEQRAWYDTLRDFLPLIKGLKATVRLFARDFTWCSLDSDNPTDIRKFEDILRGSFKSREINIRKDRHPFLARVILSREWDGNPEEAKKLLEGICKKWPKGEMVKFVITCGGFIQFDWPESLSRREIGDNINPNKECVDVLVREAKKYVKFILSDGLNEKLRKFTDYITLGIDSYKTKISTTQNYIGQPHIELVFLIDLRNNKTYWTGKSYPTPSQQNGLIRISDLKKHFFELDNVGKVMILGCHDLTVFNPRSKNATGWRERVNKEFRKLAQKEKPVIVLHHPHTTDSTLTWAAAWNGLMGELPFVKAYAGAGRYYNSEGERSEINDVLEKTKLGSTIDFIVL